MRPHERETCRLFWCHRFITSAHYFPPNSIDPARNALIVHYRTAICATSTSRISGNEISLTYDPYIFWDLVRTSVLWFLYSLAYWHILLLPASSTFTTGLFSNLAYLKIKILKRLFLMWILSINNEISCKHQIHLFLFTRYRMKDYHPATSIRIYILIDWLEAICE